MAPVVIKSARATSKALHDIGAVNGKDMTTEAALTKLYHLFSLDIPKEEIKGSVGAGDAFCAGASIGLTYGKTFPESIEIGSHLAASVITSSENVCPRFLPQEFGIDVKVED